MLGHRGYLAAVFVAAAVLVSSASSATLSISGPQAAGIEPHDGAAAQNPEPVAPEAGPVEPVPDMRISNIKMVADGYYVEHTPSIARAQNGTYFIAYESASSISGKFTINLTWSLDGSTWARSRVVITSAGTMGNRHPTLVCRQDGTLMMAYFSDRTGAYRVYTATSATGVTWAESGALALQNPAVNPFLIQEDNGAYAMSYQRYGSASDGSYFARSLDGTAWTASGTRVTTRSLPRLMRASGNGNYLMTHQGGTTGDFEIRYRTSADGTTWGAEQTLTDTGNSHDSFPMQCANGTYVVYFATAVGSTYDLFRKFSTNMVTWTADQAIPFGNTLYDTEPHVMQVAANHTTALVWGYETVASYGDVEVALAWIEDPQPLPSAFANITVAAGWNLASIPLATNLSNQELPGALDRAEASVVWTRVMAWDGATQRWLQHNKGWPSWMNTLTSLNHSVGFWLYVTTVGDGQLCVGGAGYAVPTSTSIYLYVGWNLVGFPSDDAGYTVAALKGATGATIVEGYDAGQTYKTSVMADAATLAQGKAYWVWVPANVIWTKTW